MPAELKVHKVQTPNPQLHVGQFADRSSPLHLDHANRMYHSYVVGGSGSGKSKFLEYLIRQDIKNWPESRAGMLVIDPHGALYDSIVMWLAAANATRPVVPIDLRRTDSVVGYDLLRQRTGFEPSVVTQQLVDAIAYSWGADGTSATPQFARWMNLILGTLYHLHRSFAEVPALIADERFRRQCVQSITDPTLKVMWKATERLKPEAFLEQVNSSLNRLPRLFLNTNLARMFSQTPSFDFHQALEEGQIVLVCLGEDNGQLSQQDARTLGTLLLADLWTAAKQRGKPTDASKVKPFYVYLDEFQTCLTPTIAQNLEQARGYGLWLTLAHQGPYQLLREGSHGQSIFSSILTNCQNKVVFRTRHPEDLDRLVQSMFLGSIDVDKIKYTIESTKVLDYEREETTSMTRTSSTHSARRESAGHKEVPTDREDPEGDHKIVSYNREEDEATTETELVAESTQESLVPVMGKETTSIGYESVDEQFWRAKQYLAAQEPRHAVAQLVGFPAPVRMMSATVSVPKASFYTIELYTQKLQALWPFIVQRDDAVSQAPESDGSSNRPTDIIRADPRHDDDEDAIVWRRVR